MKLGTKCACEMVGSPPEEILPGESGSIRFRLRGPYLGKMQRKIPLLVDGASEPAAVFDVSLLVKFEPPRLVPPPGGLSITFVHGDRSSREIVLEAIEARQAGRWIRGLKLRSGDGIEVERCLVEELREPDPALIRRRYRLLLVNRSLPVGPHLAVASVRTSPDLPRLEEPISLRIDVADSVAIAPNPLVFKYVHGMRPPSRTVRLINRTGNRAAVAVATYDHNLLRVEAGGKHAGPVAAFDVAPILAPESALETEVVFNIGDDEKRGLVIRFEPAEPR